MKLLLKILNISYRDIAKDVGQKRQSAFLSVERGKGAGYVAAKMRLASAKHDKEKVAIAEQAYAQLKEFLGR
jgi:hypothetical protein